MIRVQCASWLRALTMGSAASSRGGRKEEEEEEEDEFCAGVAKRCSRAAAGDLERARKPTGTSQEGGEEERRGAECLRQTKNTKTQN